jgi:hypothetical protein
VRLERSGRSGRTEWIAVNPALLKAGEH